MPLLLTATAVLDQHSVLRAALCRRPVDADAVERRNQEGLGPPVLRLRGGGQGKRYNYGRDRRVYRVSLHTIILDQVFRWQLRTYTNRHFADDLHSTVKNSTMKPSIAINMA